MEGFLVALYLTGMALVILFFRGVRIVTDDENSSEETECAYTGTESAFNKR